MSTMSIINCDAHCIGTRQQIDRCLSSIARAVMLRQILLKDELLFEIILPLFPVRNRAFASLRWIRAWQGEGRIFSFVVISFRQMEEVLQCEIISEIWIEKILDFSFLSKYIAVFHRKVSEVIWKFERNIVNCLMSWENVRKEREGVGLISGPSD